MSDPCRFCGKPQHPMISCREANPPWHLRDCPHGYSFDCCTQCHDAFHAGRESMAPAPKPTHEERARALADKQWKGPNPRKDMIADIAAQFAQVEAEAKLTPKAWLAAMAAWKPTTPPVADSFFGILPPTYMPDADGGREAVVPLRACTCGAASCGSRLHSSWCSLA